MQLHAERDRAEADMAKLDQQLSEREAQLANNPAKQRALLLQVVALSDTPLRLCNACVIAVTISSVLAAQVFVSHKQVLLAAGRRHLRQHRILATMPLMTTVAMLYVVHRYIHEKLGKQQRYMLEGRSKTPHLQGWALLNALCMVIWLGTP